MQKLQEVTTGPSKSFEIIWESKGMIEPWWNNFDVEHLEYL